MILTPHMLIGAAIGAKVHNFWAVIILALFSHFLLDRLPHWEYAHKTHLHEKSKKEFSVFALQGMVDFLIGLAIVIWLFWTGPLRWWALVGAIFGMLPDLPMFLLGFTYSLFGRKIKILEKYYWLHHKNHIPRNKNTPGWGVITEILVVLVALWVILG